MTTTTLPKTTSVAQPILVALGRAAQATRVEEPRQPNGTTDLQREARDRAMEEPERWDGMA